MYEQNKDGGGSAGATQNTAVAGEPAGGKGGAGDSGAGAGGAGDGKQVLEGAKAGGESGAAKEGAAKEGEGKKADAGAEGAKKDSATKEGSEGKGAPEAYDLKLPENSLLSAERVESLKSFAKEKGLSNEQAQAILEREHQAVADFVKDNSRGGAAWDKQMDGWEAEALAAKDIGNGNKDTLKANAELAHRGFKAFAPDLMSVLEDTGYGSHPGVIRLGVILGRMAADGKMPSPGSQGGAGEKSTAELFYGKSE